jgi:hypothetical protein
VENYEEDSFEIEDEDDEDLLVDNDDIELEHQLGAKESTPSETGTDRLANLAMLKKSLTLILTAS